VPVTGFVLYDSLVKKVKDKSNVTVIPRKNKRTDAAYSGVMDVHEYAVLNAVMYCERYGFDAEQLPRYFRNGADSLGKALTRLVQMGIVERIVYNVYDSGIRSGLPRLEFEYSVNYPHLEFLAERKKENKQAPSPTVEPLRERVELPQLSLSLGEDNKKEKKPRVLRERSTMDASVLRPSKPEFIMGGTRTIGNLAIHEIHLAHQKVVLRSKNYEAEHKDKLQPFLEKLARDGNVLADLDTFVGRFNAYLDVCYENADKWAELNGALKVPSKNERSINGLLLALREPFSTVSFTEYQERFFALMNEQHRIIDKNSVVYANSLREIHNKGELEKHFNSLPKKMPHQSKK
jgi:hypothetical protein